MDTCFARIGAIWRRTILLFVAGVLSVVAQTTLAPLPPEPTPAPAGAGKDLVVEIRERAGKQASPAALPRHVAASSTAPRVHGETVYARVSELAADVEGIHEVGATPREILVPVFTASKTRPAEVVEEARLRVMLDDIEFSEVTPAAAPYGVAGLPRGVKVVWLTATAAPAEAARLAAATGTTLRVSYRQPLLHDRLLLLPVVIPDFERAAAGRAWPCQLFVRSPDRLLPPPEPPADSQHLGDILVVYLRDRQLVDLALPPRKRPAKSP